MYDSVKFVNAGQYEVLELLLQDERVDTSSCLFLLAEGHDKPVTHFITLKQFIQAVKPDNVDQLLALIERGKGNLYVRVVRGFLSKFNPFSEQTESVVDEEASGYTQFRFDKLSESHSCGCRAVLYRGPWIEHGPGVNVY
jgi:hypothetical protein